MHFNKFPQHKPTASQIIHYTKQWTGGASPHINHLSNATSPGCFGGKLNAFLLRSKHLVKFNKSNSFMFLMGGQKRPFGVSFSSIQHSVSSNQHYLSFSLNSALHLSSDVHLFLLHHSAPLTHSSLVLLTSPLFDRFSFLWPK